MPVAGTTESVRLANLLRLGILEGRFPAGDPFPSLRELAQRHRTGVRVARTATDILVREGLLHRRERSGTFVRRAPQVEAANRGMTLRCVNILERGTGTLPGFVRVDYLQGYTQALDAHSVRMRVMGLPASPEGLGSVISDRYAFRQQGCILVNIVQQEIFNWLEKHQIPFVVQNYTQYPKAALRPHHSVVVNKVGGAFRAVQHLIDLGHRRIGYAGHATESPHGTVEVYEGYLAALHCAGLEPRPEDVFAVNTDDPATAYEPALRCLKGRDLPTAILARNDSGAIGLVRAARALGLRVPEDLSVVGFNDQTEAAACEPALTTVAVPRVQLGREAVEVLLTVAQEKPQESVAHVLACHLVERASTAVPRPRGG